MAGPFKCTVFYRLDDWGWSETYYNSDTDVSAVGVEFGNLLTARDALLCTDVQVTGARICDVDTARDTWVFAPPDAAGTYTGGIESYDPVYTRVLQAYDGLGKWSIRRLHALPEDCVGTNRLFTPSAAWTIAISAYRGEVAGGTWAIRVSDGAIPPTYSYRNIQSIVEKPKLRNRKLGRPFGLPVGRVLIG